MALLKTRRKLLHVFSLFRLVLSVEFAVAVVIARVLVEIVNIRPVDESVLGAIVLFFVTVLFVLVRDIGFEIEKLVARWLARALSLWLYKPKASAKPLRIISILR